MKMRTLIVASTLALTMAVMTVAQEKPGSGSAPGVPKLVMTTFNHDFGEIKPGTPLNHSFIVKNQGKGDLLITSVTPGCGCTASNFDKVIAPGKEGKITLEIAHTEPYSGEVAKSATVVTNDPLSPSFNLMLRAYFTPGPPPPPGPGVNAPSPIAIAGAGKMVGPFTVSPGDRWVTSVLTGSSSTGTLNLYNGSATVVRVKKVIPGGTDFTVNFQTIQEGKRYELAVATNPALKPGQYHQTIRILTDSKDAPEMDIELAVTVYPRVFVTPTSMNLAQLSSGTDSAAATLPLIYVRKLRGGGLKVNSVTSTLPFINMSVAAEAEGQIYTIRLTIDKSKITTPGEFKGKIRIETNDADTPVLEVPVQGSIS